LVWLGGSGVFGTAGNWNDRTTPSDPALTPPGPGDTAQFTTGGGTITGSGTVDTLQFFGAATWILADNAQVADTGNFLDSGNLTIESGASLISAGGPTVGGTNGAPAANLLVTGAGSYFAVTGPSTYFNVGNGSVSVVNGGSVEVAYLVYLGEFPGSSSLSVDGTSTFEVGSAGGATAGAVTIDPSANGVTPQIYGFGTIDANLVNNGYLSASTNASGLAMEVTGAVTGTGLIELGFGYSPAPGTIVPGSTVRLDGAVGAGQQVVFSNYEPVIDAAPTLTLADPRQFAGALTDFSNSGDTLNLLGETVTGVSVSGSVLTVSVASGGPLTFNLDTVDPVTSQLTYSGSEVRVLPIREFDWTGSAGNSFGNPLNWNDVTDGVDPASSAPGTTDLAAFTNAGSITGNGSVYQVSFAGTNTVTGTLTAAGLVNNLNALSEAGGTLTVTGALSAASAVISGVLAARSGGRIVSTGQVSLSSGSSISVDAGSSIEIGTADTPTAGAITLDAEGGPFFANGTLAAPVVNNGFLYVLYGSAGTNVLEITGAVTGTGQISISGGYSTGADSYVPGGMLILDSTVGSGEQITIGGASDPGASGTLVLENPLGFAGTLNQLGSAGAVLDLVGETINSASVWNGTLTVNVLGGSPLAYTLGYGAPTTSQLHISGSLIRVLPDRQFVWTGAIDNNFTTPGNWNDTTDGLDPAATAPGATDRVVMTDAGVVVGNDTVDQLTFQGIETLAGTVSSTDSMTENSGTLTVTGSLHAGYIDDLSTIVAGAGGHIATAGSLRLAPGSQFTVDATASAEIGSAGGAAVGYLTVDADGGGISGDGTLAASVVNNAVINVGIVNPTDNDMDITGALTGIGTVVLDGGYGSAPNLIVTGATLQLGAAVGAGQTIEFHGLDDPRESPTLILNDAAGFAGTLRDFDSTGDTLQLLGETTTGVSVSGTIMTVSLAVGSPLTFNLAGNLPVTTELLAAGSEIEVVPVRELVWTGASNTAFANALNWNDTTEGLDPAAAPPGNADLATIVNAGTVTGNGTAYQLILGGTNTLTGSVAVVSTLTETSGATTVTGTLSAEAASLAGALTLQSGGDFVSTGALTLVAGAELSVDAASFAEAGPGGMPTEGALTVDSGSASYLIGDGTVAAALVDNGQIYIAPGPAGDNQLEVVGPVTGSGAMTMGAGYNQSLGSTFQGAILQLDSSVAAGIDVWFNGAGNPALSPELVLADPTGFGGTLVNFNTAGDTLDLPGQILTGATVSGSVLTVTRSLGTPLTFKLTGGIPETGELYASGSTVAVVPLRDLNWTGTSGTAFGTAGNWNDTSDGLNPAASAPTAEDLATLNYAGVVTGTGSAFELGFTGANTVAGTLSAVTSVTDAGDKLTVTGALTAASTTLTNTISAQTGGRFVSTGLVQMSGAAELAVDGASSIEVGTAGGAAAGSVTVDASTSVGIDGDGTIAAPFVNNGLIDVAGGIAGSNTLEVSGAVTGSGSLLIDGGTNPSADVFVPGGVLRLDASTATSETVQFDSAANPAEAPSLILETPAAFQGTLSGFDTGGDRLTLLGDTVTGASILGTTMTVTLAGGGPLTFALANTPPTTSLSWSGADVTVATACFLPGTMILTPDGEIPVERLVPGDAVMTASGRVRPVTWIGTGRHRARLGRRDAATPVIVRRGALAPNVPVRDLRITKGHALFLDGVLIPVEFLINHRLIHWDDQPREVTLFHVELDRHDILVADGAPAESYRDDGNRWTFQNANSAWYEAPKPPCAPVLTGGSVVDQVWRRLLDRCGPQPVWPLTDDADPHLVVDGARVDPILVRDRTYVFELDHATGPVRLVSRASEPAAMGFARDFRTLGIAVRWIAVCAGPRSDLMEAQSGALTGGFHGYEPDAGIRWTDGDADIPACLFDGLTGRRELLVCLGGTTRYAVGGGQRVAA
jgi:hypothetical protein